jgi:hypothetical protein
MDRCRYCGSTRGLNVYDRSFGAFCRNTVACTKRIMRSIGR